MNEDKSAMEVAIDKAIEAVEDTNEEWLGAYRGTAWAQIALAIGENNKSAYLNHLAFAALDFLGEKSPENYAALEQAAEQYRGSL